MFDANMRYLEIGHRFFCYIHGKDDPNRPCYLKAGELYLCQMLEETDDNPMVKFYLPEGLKLYWKETDMPDNLLATYEGSTNGQGFVDNESYKEALAILGGKWDEA